MYTEAIGGFVFSNTPLTYRQAIQTCEIVYNGRLVRESDIGHLAHQLSENTNYWSDKYTSLSDWINYEGWLTKKYKYYICITGYKSTAQHSRWFLRVSNSAKWGVQAIPLILTDKILLKKKQIR